MANKKLNYNELMEKIEWPTIFVRGVKKTPEIRDYSIKLSLVEKALERLEREKRGRIPLSMVLPDYVISAYEEFRSHHNNTLGNKLGRIE
jgi:hypothetical protein